MLIKIIVVLIPFWTLKRFFLIKFFKYDLHPDSKIGLAWVFPKKLKLEKGSKIDHLTVAIHLDTIWLGENSLIGRSNWITGFPSGTDSKHFKHQPERISELIIGKESAITKNHHIDCTNRVEIGNFSTVAGYYSQILTHSINLDENKQDSAPIIFGDYTFIGTNSVVLGGSVLPSYSVLGAKSLLNKTFIYEHKLYAGVPCKEVGDIPENSKYFLRESGFVY